MSNDLDRLRVLREDSLSSRPAVEELKIPASVSSFSDLRSEGLEVFSLGPTYALGGVNEDLISAFFWAEREMPQRGKVRTTSIHFDFPVILRCGDWDTTLSVMDAVSYNWFKAWLKRMNFRNREEKRVFLSRVHSAPIMDPIAQVNDELRPTALDVWCPSFPDGQIVPKLSMVSNKSKTPMLIDFVKVAPEPELVSLGKFLLGGDR